MSSLIFVARKHASDNRRSSKPREAIGVAALYHMKTRPCEPASSQVAFKIAFLFSRQSLDLLAIDFDEVEKLRTANPDVEIREWNWMTIQLGEAAGSAESRRIGTPEYQTRYHSSCLFRELFLPGPKEHLTQITLASAISARTSRPGSRPDGAFGFHFGALFRFARELL